MQICPRLEIDINKIKHNSLTLTKLCKEKGIDVAGVTKVFCGIPEIAQALVHGGITMLADSRIENLKKLQEMDAQKLLLRLPMISQAKETVRYADISLNSEIKTIAALDAAAKELERMHNIILMIDMGDLREGVWQDQIENTISEILLFENINLLGIGTNLTCYGGVIPNRINLGRLVEIAEIIEDKFNISLNIVSGGNSSSLYLLEKEEIPHRINHLRLGESIVLGRETAYGNSIADTYQDAFTLVTEVVELKEKPSVPIGEIGMDAFGNKPVFEDRGLRKRAILAIGRQDIAVQNIIPLDPNMMILGASSDHLIIDVTDCTKEYMVGDEVRFHIEYGALLQVMTSEYIHKKLL
ncbi:ornithine racemase Orr [Anaerosolibacter sp.]|uniref:ornithine racemase Orr n=1 Tax=Anaerosolibacter sp. TaxID=1872527 RepID=UPI0039EF4F01